MSSLSNGFVVQGSHVGVLAGPPVFAMFVAAFGGWEQGWMLMAALGITGLGVTAAIRGGGAEGGRGRGSVMLPTGKRAASASPGKRTALPLITPRDAIPVYLRE